MRSQQQIFPSQGSRFQSAIVRMLPYVALTALTLIVLPTILTPGKLLCTAVDASHFLYRLHEINWLSEQGIVWPRWGPNMSYGYGYPIFHFYGSLSFYPSLILHKLGASLVTAFQGGFWLALVCSGWAAFAWLESALGDRRAAMIGATTYLFVPYHLNTIAYRWNLPEPWALVFAPLALYGLSQMAKHKRWRTVALTALAVAALPLISNLATLIFAPLLVTYALLLLAQSKKKGQLLTHLIVCAGLALALTAFFWLPAFVDRNLVQLERGYTSGGVSVFNHALPLKRLFQQPLIADVSRANPLYDPLSLGSIIPAAGGAILIFGFKKLTVKTRQLTIWGTLLMALCLWLAVPAGQGFFRLLPFLNVLQFPWRFLAPGTLLVTLLTGCAAQVIFELVPRRWSAVVTAAITIVPVLLGWPLLYPGLTCPISPTPTLGEAVAAQVGMVGTISTNAEYLPVTVQEIPDLSPMFGPYVHGEAVIRWDQSRLPDSAQTLAISDDGLSARWQVDSPVPFEALYQAFMFPGWQAMIDQKPVEIQVAPPYGLIQIAVPAGAHTIEVHFGSTPLRTAAAGVSFAALAIMLAMISARWKNRGDDQSYQGDSGSGALWGILVGIGILLLVLRVSVVDLLDWLPRTRRFDGNTVRGIEHPVSIDFSTGERLLGYDLLTQPTSAGDELLVDLYWASSSGAPFRALLRLVDEQGTWTDWNQIVDFPGLVGPPAPSLWSPERYTMLRYHIDIPPGTPPGAYMLSVATIDPQSKHNHFVIGPSLNSERTEAAIGQVTIKRKNTTKIELQSQMENGRYLYEDEYVMLVRCPLSRTSATVGERIQVEPLWYRKPSTSKSWPGNLSWTLQLTDSNGVVVLAHNRTLPNENDTLHWHPGELRRDPGSLLIPPHLDAGTYTWVIEIEDTIIPLSTLEVDVPTRSETMPENLVPVQIVLDEFAELAGFEMGELVPGSALSVHLAWRAIGKTTRDYKVFVHLVNDEGMPVAQSDAVPAAWTRPTPSWLPPEVIEDAHTLYPPVDLPAGTYRLVIGLYEPKTGRRATTPEGKTIMVLDKLEW